MTLGAEAVAQGGEGVPVPAGAQVQVLRGFYEGLEAETLGALAKRFLDLERASVLVVNPREEAEGKAEEAGADQQE